MRNDSQTTRKDVQEHVSHHTEQARLGVLGGRCAHLIASSLLPSESELNFRQTLYRAGRVEDDARMIGIQKKNEIRSANSADRRVEFTLSACCFSGRAQLEPEPERVVSMRALALIVDINRNRLSMGLSISEKNIHINQI
jgi:hypothetical protein